MSAFRLPDEAALQALLKRSHVRVVRKLVDDDELSQQASVARAAKKKRPEDSPLEAAFLNQIAEANLPEPEPHYPHLRGHKHDLDFAWPTLMLGVEIQGAPHRIKDKWHRDIVKRALGITQGWKVLELDRDSIYNGDGIRWLKTLMGRK